MHRRVRLFKLFLNIDPAFLAGKPGQLLSLCGLQHSVDENAIALCRAIDQHVRDRADQPAVLQDGAAGHG